jgi:hypothetical protein
MHPWERRLKDLAQSLVNCASTYFDPDAFRMNVNHFLQTSRTVTFIIQKNKTKIPNFVAWYEVNVLEKWRDDVVMGWARDSRNIIEKEGDLDLNSTLSVTLIFSYLKEDDSTISLSSDDLLNAGIKKLIRLARKGLPTEAANAASIKVERRWVTGSLREWELLHALTYVYGRILLCCEQLAEHLGADLDSEIPAGRDVEQLRNDARRVQFVKLRDETVRTMKTTGIENDTNFEPPEKYRDYFSTVRTRPERPANYKGTMGFFASMAEMTFKTFGSHIPMLYFFNEEWGIIDVMSTHFDDRAEKYLFWRVAAERAASVRARGFVWISEAWHRQPKRAYRGSVEEMPIVGERLIVVGMNQLGQIDEVVWHIRRNSPDDSPTLELMTDSDQPYTRESTYYFVPVTRAMGIPDPPGFNPRRAR